MRFFRLLVITLIAIPSVGYSQLSVGARAGYSLSSAYFLPTQKEKALLDNVIDAGLVVKYFDLTYFGLQVEANYTQRGYRTPFNQDFLYKRVNSYLEFPLFMQVRYQQNGFFAHLNVGFFASFLLSSAEGYNTQGSYSMTNYEFSLIRDNRFDYGIPAGVGIGYSFKSSSIQAEVRYFHGLGDLYHHDYEGNPARSAARVQNISISYLYSLSNLLGKREKLNMEEF